MCVRIKLLNGKGNKMLFNFVSQDVKRRLVDVLVMLTAY